MSREIPATKGFAAIVDDEDFERLSVFRWYAHHNSHGAHRPARRTSPREGRKVLFLTHQIMRAPPGLVVDHINGDPWDNRRENLRICTHAENLRNQRRKPRAGLYKGVSRRGRSFFALICCDKAIYPLGTFKTAEAAALAYDAAALALHGDFAAPNFPEAGTLPAHPAEMRAAALAERDAHEAAISEMFRDGLNAVQIAKLRGIPASSARSIAARRGIELHRGRPRSITPTPESQAA